MDKTTIFLIFITGLTVVLTLYKVLDRYVVHQNDLQTNVLAGETETFPFEEANQNNASNPQSAPNDQGQTIPPSQENQNDESIVQLDFDKIFQESDLEKTGNSVSDNDASTFDEIFSETSEGASSTASPSSEEFNNMEDAALEHSNNPDPPARPDSSDNSHKVAQQLLSSFISLTLLEKVGFRNVTLQRIPFSGMLFDEIDLEDGLSLDVVVQNVLRNNSTVEATFYQFLTKSHLVAEEVYKLLKDKASVQENLFVNETNQFGNGSFYVNFSEEKNVAFLVVKKGESVYALSYKKSYHAFIKMLLQLLP